MEQSHELPPRCRRGVRGWVARLVLYPLLAYVAWCTALYFFQDTLIFPRKMAPEPMPRVPRDVVSLRLDIETGGQVEAWFLPAYSASPDHPVPAVISFHGNGELIDYQDHVSEVYRRWGFSVLLPEYRGYGRSAGRPSEQGIVADAVRFYDELIKRPDVDPKRIVIRGHSLGGGVAAQLAARRTPAALILESTFTSIASFAHLYGAPEFLARHQFRTDSVIASLNVPVLIAHGTEDLIVPIRHGRRLHRLVPQARYVEFSCDHMLPDPANESAYHNLLRRFLADSGVLSAETSPSP